MSKVLIDRELLERAVYRMELAYDADAPIVCDLSSVLSAPSGTPAMPVKAYYHEAPNEYGGFNKSVGLEVRKAFIDAPLVLESDAMECITCLEGGIAKRDARIVELESAAESLRLSRDYHHEQEIEYRRRWAGIYAAPVPEAKAQGVVQWPEADEIMQMAFEEGQPADDASGYCFELEEFDLFIERLMSEVARLNAAPAAPAADGWISVSERLPDVPDGDEREVIVCVKRAHNGQSYSFSARYLNNFPLHSDSEDEPMIVTGWHDVKEHAEYDGWYSPLIDSSSGDEVTHWMPLPTANRANGVV